MTAPPENHAILLEDGPSLCLREGKAWKLTEIRTGVREGWSGVREDMLCLGLTFI